MVWGGAGGGGGEMGDVREPSEGRAKAFFQLLPLLLPNCPLPDPTSHPGRFFLPVFFFLPVRPPGPSPPCAPCSPDPTSHSASAVPPTRSLQDAFPLSGRRFLMTARAALTGLRPCPPSTNSFPLLRLRSRTPHGHGAEEFSTPHYQGCPPKSSGSRSPALRWRAHPLA